MYLWFTKCTHYVIFEVFLHASLRLFIIVFISLPILEHLCTCWLARNKLYYFICYFVCVCQDLRLLRPGFTGGQDSVFICNVSLKWCLCFICWIVVEVQCSCFTDVLTSAGNTENAWLTVINIATVMHTIFFLDCSADRLISFPKRK